MKIKEEVAKLKSVDIYSFILFAMFKIRELPEFSALSELVYVLDKENFLKLCEYFGGMTLRIPTIDEVESIVRSLQLFNMVDIEGIPYDKAIKIVSSASKDAESRQIKMDYVKVKELLANYSITAREK